MLIPSITPADTKGSIESLLFNEGGIISGVYGGDSILTGYCGVAINLNLGGFTNGYGGGNNTQSYVPGYSALLLICVHRHHKQHMIKDYLLLCQMVMFRAVEH
jgi:hypothetical protein